MADLDAAIRATLAEIESTLTDDYGRVAEFGNLFATRPVAALRAVLDIHAPFVRHPDTQPEYVRCSGCSFPNVTSIEWPCATVRAIAAHLGVPQAEKPQP